MRVKTFEAVDMKQALNLVKDEMGPRAVIVSSRPIKKDGKLFGMLGRTVLEVTAAVEEGEKEDPVNVRTVRAPDLPSGRGRGTGAYHDIWTIKQAVEPVLDEIRTLKEGLSGHTPEEESQQTDLRADVAQIRTMLASFVGSGNIQADPQGAAAQRLFYFLMGRGIDEALSRSLVQRVVARIDSGALGDLERLKLNLAAEMRADIARAQRGSAPSRIQVFVGPTGVGKTTTIAKLAARAARSAPDSVLIITTDVHRVAAVEQAMRFGESMSVQVKVAISPEDLRRTVLQAENKEKVFIDTPGRSHRDTTAFRSLRGNIDLLDDAEVMLVLSATSRAADSQEILEAYSVLPCSRLILTKLDETRIYGELYNCIVRSGRPIACVTTGQAVPEHLETMDIPGILRRVLHG